MPVFITFINEKQKNEISHFRDNETHNLYVCAASELTPLLIVPMVSVFYRIMLGVHC